MSFKNKLSLSKNRKNPIFFTFFLVTCLLPAFFSCLKPAYGEEFASKTYGFAVSYPCTFNQVQIPVPNIALALRSKEGPFPTFNILAQAGTYAGAQKSNKEQEEAIVNDYRSVGLMNATMLGSSNRIINGSNSFEYTLSYTQDKLSLRSYVGIITGLDKHFIITFIDEAERFEKSQDLARAFLDSFQILGGKSFASPLNSETPWLIYLISLVLFIGLILIFRFRHIFKIA